MCDGLSNVNFACAFCLILADVDFLDLLDAFDENETNADTVASNAVGDAFKLVGSPQLPGSELIPGSTSAAQAPLGMPQMYYAPEFGQEVAYGEPIYDTNAIAAQHALLMHQQLQVSVPQSVPTMTAATYSKKGRSPEELAEQIERVKKRRRESARRSRQRKSAYVSGLESENKALKVENQRLREQLARMSA